MDPLDEELKYIIKRNSHHVRNHQDMILIQHFIEAIAEHQYRMEIWSHIRDGEHRLDAQEDYKG